MGGRDQSQVKIKFKKFEKVKSVPKDIPKSHNNDTRLCWGRLSWARARSHDAGIVGEGVEGTKGENKGRAEGNWGRRGRGYCPIKKGTDQL